MTSTTARIKKSGKPFEIMVDLEKALNVRKGVPNAGVSNALEHDEIFSDIKRGLRASSSDLKNAFGTEDVFRIAEEIMKSGEILLTQDFRDKAQEEQYKKIIDAIARNAVDPKTSRPYTPGRIKTALEEARVVIKNKSIEEQIPEIIEQLQKILPIKMEKKRVKITIPAVHTGRVYGLIASYKEKEDWKNNGDLVVIVAIPAGMQMEFYDKLNSMTHGAALTEEVKD